uniref:Uncharacterized protein n=1 Tax=Oryza sativa subsp. japonica TaxID=39947 RepID=Q2QRV2_ORYSJ|nr:hypothetical protein LOC_Os12g26300 [Oryza sativa Japonica Group]
MVVELAATADGGGMGRRDGSAGKETAGTAAARPREGGRGSAPKQQDPASLAWIWAGHCRADGDGGVTSGWLWRRGCGCCGYGGGGCGDRGRYCGVRRHGGLGWLAWGVADGRIWPARQCLEEGLEAGSAQRGAANGSGDRHGARRRGRRRWRPAWHERRGRWQETGLVREARPALEEAGVARRDETRPVVEEATLVRGGAAGGCGVVYGKRRLAGRGRRCSGPTYRQRLSDGGGLVHQL